MHCSFHVGMKNNSQHFHTIRILAAMSTWTPGLALLRYVKIQFRWIWYFYFYFILETGAWENEAWGWERGDRAWGWGLNIFVMTEACRQFWHWHVWVGRGLGSDYLFSCLFSDYIFLWGSKLADRSWSDYLFCFVFTHNILLWWHNHADRSMQMGPCRWSNFSGRLL